MKKKRNTTPIVIQGLLLLAALFLVLFPTPAWAPPDSDGDGVANNKDECPGTPVGESVDGNGCALSQLDADGDGYTADLDCNDGDPTINPGAIEDCSTPLIDENCDGITDSADVDGDSFDACLDDCDDNDPTVNPGVAESDYCTDGKDNDCDTLVDTLDTSDCAVSDIDTDNDGYSDAAEANITLPTGMTLADGTTNTLPAYPGSGPRELYADAYTADVYVIMNRAASGSNIPWPTSYPTYDSDPVVDAIKNPLRLIGEPQGPGDSGGLGLATHEVLPNGSTERIIAGSNYAVWVNESLDPSGSLMGTGIPVGPPGATSTATVWTERIKNWINSNCNSAGFDEVGNDGIIDTYYTPADVNSGGENEISEFKCKDDQGRVEVDMTNPTNLGDLHQIGIQNIINHEVGHTVSLPHDAGLSDVVMESSWPPPKATKRGSKVTVILYFAKDYSGPSKAAVDLVQ